MRTFFRRSPCSAVHSRPVNYMGLRINLRQPSGSLEVWDLNGYTERMTAFKLCLRPPSLCSIPLSIPSRIRCRIRSFCILRTLLILSLTGLVCGFACTPAYQPENLVPLLDHYIARLTNRSPPLRRSPSSNSSKLSQPFLRTRRCSPDIKLTG
jgi:hypothetical protein